ncbi:hypothetical protein FPRO03_14127 [Fusarium proliferatum]|nr:hypothetical protein FPRO03_14127 [Fusarium proliferatum]
MSLVGEATARFKFVDAQEHDPALVRRRRLEAKRAQDYRRRRKAKQNTNTADHQTELPCQVVEPGTGTRQLGPSSAPDDIEEFGQDDIPAENISITSGQEGGDPNASSIGQDTYGDETPVNVHYAEEYEVQTASQTPEFYAKQEAGLPDGNTWSDMEYSTEKFI